MASDDPAITCPHCETAYRAAADQAGGIFVCSCGRRLAVPETATGPAYVLEDDVRGDLAPCPQCRRLWNRDARVCTTCGYDFYTGGQYRVETDNADRDSPMARYNRTWAGRLYRWKDREIPIAMAVAGTLTVVMFHIGLLGFDEFVKLLGGWALMVGLMAGWMLAMLSVIELIINRDFGPWHEQLVKVFGIAAALSTTVFILSWYLGIDGYIISLPILFIMQVALMRWLFELSWFAAVFVSLGIVAGAVLLM